MRFSLRNFDVVDALHMEFEGSSPLVFSPLYAISFRPSSALFLSSWLSYLYSLICATVNLQVEKE
jgi:hypothetical protein